MKKQDGLSGLLGAFECVNGWGSEQSESGDGENGSVISRGGERMEIT